MKILSSKITRIFIACILIILGAISYSNADIKINNQEGKYLNEYNKAIKNMEDNMSNVTKTGIIDLDYLYEMIVHHQGVMNMVKSIQKYSDNDEIKAIAEKEANNQMPEIEKMKELAESIK